MRALDRGRADRAAYPGVKELLRERSRAELAREHTMTSGTTSPMPHSRFQLAPAVKLDGGQLVEETVVAGPGTSAVFWRILL